MWNEVHVKEEGSSDFSDASTDSSADTAGRQSSSWTPPSQDSQSTDMGSGTIRISRRRGGERGNGAEDEAKRRMRRERNKLAAARCRQRRVDLTNQLLAETATLEDERTKLEKEIQNLERHRHQLEYVLDSHAPRCSIVTKPPRQQFDYSSSSQAAWGEYGARPMGQREYSPAHPGQGAVQRGDCSYVGRGSDSPHMPRQGSCDEGRYDSKQHVQLQQPMLRYQEAELGDRHQVQSQIVRKDKMQGPSAGQQTSSSPFTTEDRYIARGGECLRGLVPRGTPPTSRSCISGSETALNQSFNSSAENMDFSSPSNINTQGSSQSHYNFVTIHHQSQSPDRSSPAQSTTPSSFRTRPDSLQVSDCRRAGRNWRGPDSLLNSSSATVPAIRTPLYELGLDCLVDGHTGLTPLTGCPTAVDDHLAVPVSAPGQAVGMGCESGCLDLSPTTMMTL